MKPVYLEYLSEFDDYGLKKEVVSALSAQGQVLEILLPKNIDYKPKETAPMIGFLLGQNKSASGEEYYSVSKHYLRAILNTGCRVRFLDYENPAQQLKDCHGAVLPGGTFDLPESFYTDNPIEKSESVKRYLAYQSVCEEAYKARKPLLGICAGAQVIGALMGGMKMYCDLENQVPNAVQHQIKKGESVCLHSLKLVPDTPLFSILGLPPAQESIVMNSRHKQAMQLDSIETARNPPVKMQMYAVCQGDGIPEIWGNDEAGVLCVQGHPEDLAQKQADGTSNLYQKIYDWVVAKAQEYKNTDVKDGAA